MLALLCFLTLPLHAEVPIPDANEVIVVGEPSARFGTTLRQVVSRRPLQQETTPFVEQDSSWQATSIGHSSASGFSLPSIRGLDSGLTDIYIEEFSVQNQYTSLPVAEDLDLAAFGRLSIFRGMPPPHLASASPAGILQFKFLDTAGTSYKLGLGAGMPYGLSGWAAASRNEKINSKDLNTARIYVRQHQSSGAFSYYDDRGTPFSPEDDELATRTHNGSKSFQALPSFALRRGPVKLRGISRLFSSENEIPGRGQLKEQWQKQKRRGAFVGFSSGMEFSAFGNTHEGGIKLQHSSETFLTRHSLAYQPTYSEDMDTTNQTLGPTFNLQFSKLHLHLETQQEETTIHKIPQDNVKRTQRRTAQQHHLGATVYLPLTEIEFFTLYRGHRTDQPSGEIKKDTARSLGATVTLSLSEVSAGMLPRLYAQNARTERLPSLLEEIGDGGRVEASTDLRGETITHQEVGVQHDFFNFNARFGVFQDTVSDKIQFIPTSQDHMRAQNIHQVKTKGGELSLGLQPSPIGASISVTQMQARNQDNKYLPGLPQRRATTRLLTKIDTWEAFLQARYQGEHFRDIDNHILVRDYTIYDLGIDTMWVYHEARYGGGLSVRNLLDQKSLDIEDTEGHRPGRIALSDYDGFPLPGRQILMNVLAQF